MGATQPDTVQDTQSYWRTNEAGKQNKSQKGRCFQSPDSIKEKVCPGLDVESRGTRQVRTWLL